MYFDIRLLVADYVGLCIHGLISVNTNLKIIAVTSAELGCSAHRISLSGLV